MTNRSKALVVVDMQNDFIDGALGTKEAQNIVSNIVKKIEEFDGKYIFITMDTHDYNYLSTKEGEKLDVPHCIEYTHGWLVNEQIEKAIAEKKKTDPTIDVERVKKPTFGSLTLAKIFGHGKLDDSHPYSFSNDERFIHEIELVGVCTDICVVSNAILLKSCFYDVSEITVDASCCAGTSVEAHKAALNTMKSCQINVINE